MKVMETEAVMSKGGNVVETKEHKKIYQKVHNAALKKFYENKIKSLADHKMPLHLLLMMCQDVPAKMGNLESKWARSWFMRKCMKFYQGKLKEIERSEKVGFFSFFS